MRLTKEIKKQALEDFSNETGNNIINADEFISWIKEKPDHPAYNVFFGKDDALPFPTLPRRAEPVGDRDPGESGDSAPSPLIDLMFRIPRLLRPPSFCELAAELGIDAIPVARVDPPPRMPADEGELIPVPVPVPARPTPTPTPATALLSAVFRASRLVFGEPALTARSRAPRAIDLLPVIAVTSASSLPASFGERGDADVGRGETEVARVEGPRGEDAVARGDFAVVALAFAFPLDFGAISGVTRPFLCFASVSVYVLASDGEVTASELRSGPLRKMCDWTIAARARLP